MTVIGKIVVDLMNPYREDGSVEDLSPSSSSEEIQKKLPGARLVKAFNTIWSEHLKANSKKSSPLNERDAIPIAGDDSEAISVVSTLIEQIGFTPVISGSLREGGIQQQPNSLIYNKPMTAAAMKKFLKN